MFLQINFTNDILEEFFRISREFRKTKNFIISSKEEWELNNYIYNNDIFNNTLCALAYRAMIARISLFAEDYNKAHYMTFETEDYGYRYREAAFQRYKWALALYANYPMFYIYVGLETIKYPFTYILNKLFNKQDSYYHDEDGLVFENPNPKTLIYYAFMAVQKIVELFSRKSASKIRYDENDQVVEEEAEPDELAQDESSREEDVKQSIIPVAEQEITPALPAADFPQALLTQDLPSPRDCDDDDSATVLSFSSGSSLFDDQEQSDTELEDFELDDGHPMLDRASTSMWQIPRSRLLSIDLLDKERLEDAGLTLPSYIPSIGTYSKTDDSVGASFDSASQQSEGSIASKFKKN